MVALTNQDRQGTLFKITRLNTGYRAEAVRRIEIFPGHGRGNTAVDERVTRWWEAIAQVKSLRRDAHARDHTCWLHEADFCLSTQFADGDARAAAGDVRVHSGPLEG